MENDPIESKKVVDTCPHSSTLGVSSSEVESTTSTSTTSHITEPTSKKGEGSMYETLKEGIARLGFSWRATGITTMNGVTLNGALVFPLRIADFGVVEVLTTVIESDDKFCFYMKHPALIPEDQRTRAAVYLTHVNYGLAIGNFEMDFRDGEVRIKISCALPGSKLSVEMVDHAVQVSAVMMERYFPGLLAVVYGGKDPKEAHDDCFKPNNAALIEQCQ